MRELCGRTVRAAREKGWRPFLVVETVMQFRFERFISSCAGIAVRMAETTLPKERVTELKRRFDK